MNTCIKCGCQEAFPSLPPCPTPAACPNPQPCSEVFDAQCIVFTLPDVLCGEDIVVAQDSSVAEALDGIVTYFCSNFPIASKGFVSIYEGEGFLGVNLTDVPGPVTYEWSFADKGDAFSIVGDNDTPTITFLKNNNENVYQPFLRDVRGTPNTYIVSWLALVKVIVTDANGYTYSAYYNYDETQITRQ